MPEPFHTDLERSEIRRAQRAVQPRTLMAYVRWVRWAYEQEPPTRLHTRDTGDDGAPRMSGDFLAWLRAAEEKGVACAEDADGYLRTPFRCALFDLHGRTEGTERAWLAHIALGVAHGAEPVEATLRCGIPEWASGIVTYEALKRLWERYAPLIR